MKKYAIIIILVLVTISISFNYSCKNEDDNRDTLAVYNKTTAEESIIAVDVYNQIFDIVLISSDKTDAKSINTECPSITFEPTTGYPKTLNCDFGIGCTYNEHTVSGSISAILSDRIRNQGTTISVTLTNFKIDTVEVSGTITMSVTEANVLTSGIITLTATIDNAVITTNDKNFSFDTDLTISWNLNGLTDYTDDEISITQLSMTGVNSDNKTFNIEVEEALVFSVSCKEITTGIFSATTSESNFPFSVDFGNGVCDGMATITTTIQVQIGNKIIEEEYSYEIELP